MALDQNFKHLDIREALENTYLDYGYKNPA